MCIEAVLCITNILQDSVHKAIVRFHYINIVPYIIHVRKDFSLNTCSYRFLTEPNYQSLLPANLSARQPRIANAPYLSSQTNDDSPLLSQSPLLKANIFWQSRTTAAGRSTKPFKSSRAAKPLAGCYGWRLPNQSKKHFKCVTAAMDRHFLVNSNLHFRIHNYKCSLLNLHLTSNLELHWCMLLQQY